jgi:hypothetical protein
MRTLSADPDLSAAVVLRESMSRSTTRSVAATDAGLSERQREPALRGAAVPENCALAKGRARA